jgi:hypothetical protein
MSEYKTEVEIFRPPAGESRQVAMRPGQAYVLDFEPDTAEFTLDGADLYLNFDNGTVLSLKDFMTAAGAGDFMLRLPDGAQISGKDTAESLSFTAADFHTEEPPVLCALAGYSGEALTPEAPYYTWERQAPPAETLSAAGLLASLQPEPALLTPAAADILQAACVPDYAELRPWFLFFPDVP